MIREERTRARLVVAGGAALIAAALVALSALGSRHVPVAVETVSAERVVAERVSRSAARSVIEPKQIDYAAAVETEATAQYLRAVDAENKRVAAAKAKALEAKRVAAAKSAATKSADGERGPPGGDILDALGRCESGGNPNLNTGNGYFGAFQFLPSTWRSLGYSGLPTDHSYATQKEAAGRLIARSGWGQFPGCARKLGMR